MKKVSERSNFLVDLISKIENFNFKNFKKNKKNKKNTSLEKKKIKDELKKGETTIEDVSNQRKSHVKHVGKKILILGFGIVLFTAAIIVSFQDNEQIKRPAIDPKKVFKDSTSFGSIDKKDYFMEQNVLSEQLKSYRLDTAKTIKGIKDVISKQTEALGKANKNGIKELKESQIEIIDKKMEETKTILIEKVDEEVKKLSIKQKELEVKINKVDKKPTYAPLGLKNGKIIFPDLSKQNSAQKQEPKEVKKIEMVEIIEDTYVEEEITYDSSQITQTNYSTESLETDTEKKFKPFKLHLPKSMAKVTLLEGVKAAASISGLSNPAPALLVIEDISYTANDTTSNLKGCFLGGSSIGNINTSRLEIFGTSLSCIIEGDDGKEYMIEKTFTQNKVWIKGEDGGTGIQGQIVDSSGKVIAKGAAMGFLQGIANYLEVKSKVKNTIVDTNSSDTTNIQLAQSSVTGGVASGVTSGFDLAIAKYEKILEGYYPYIDVKGGRKNLTVVFDGAMELEVKEYKKADISELRSTISTRGYE